jgi:hypothetical protein
MNRNSEVLSTVTTTTGRVVVLRHRNSLGGWANALNRAGLTVTEVAEVTQGLSDADRVGA